MSVHTVITVVLNTVYCIQYYLINMNFFQIWSGYCSIISDLWVSTVYHIARKCCWNVILCQITSLIYLLHYLFIWPSFKVFGYAYWFLSLFQDPVRHVLRPLNQNVIVVEVLHSHIVVVINFGLAVSHAVENYLVDDIFVTMFVMEEIVHLVQNDLHNIVCVVMSLQ